MRKITFLLLGTALIASTAYAGGSIFKHKSKKVNTYGVHSIGVHVCGNLECPPVRIVEGDCSGEHMSLHWGVCVCDEGYVANGDYCDPDGSGTSGGGTPTCEAGIVKLYNCETKTTTNCCPDTETCTQPTNCDCINNDDCPGQQECDAGTCKCPLESDKSEDGRNVRGEKMGKVVVMII